MQTSSKSNNISMRRVGNRTSRTGLNTPIGRHTQSNSFGRGFDPRLLSYDVLYDMEVADLVDRRAVKAQRKKIGLRKVTSSKQICMRLSGTKELIHSTEAAIKRAEQEFYYADSELLTRKAEGRMHQLQSNLKKLGKRLATDQALLDKLMADNGAF